MHSIRHVQTLFPLSSSERLWMQEKPDVYVHTHPLQGQRHGTSTAQPHFHSRLPGGPRTLAKAQGRRIARRRPRANSGWPRQPPGCRLTQVSERSSAWPWGCPTSQPRGKATDSRPLIHGHSCSSERGTSRRSPSTSRAGLRDTAGFIKAPRRLGGPQGAETNPHKFFRGTRGVAQLKPGSHFGDRLRTVRTNLAGRAPSRGAPDP